MTTTTRKQTAGNNAFLADVKHHFNPKLRARIAAIVNDPTRGEAAARDFILKAITTDADFVAALGSGIRLY